MRERLIIVFVAVAIGLVVTTLIFFLYQQTKSVPQNSPGTKSTQVQNDATTTDRLTIDSPADQSLTNRRLIEVKGTTTPDDTIIVSTNQEDVVATPTTDGKFSVSITIDAGANVIVTRSIAPNGVEAKDTRVVTYSTEEF